MLLLCYFKAGVFKLGVITPQGVIWHFWRGNERPKKPNENVKITPFCQLIFNVNGENCARELFSSFV